MEIKRVTINDLNRIRVNCLENPTRPILVGQFKDCNLKLNVDVNYGHSKRIKGILLTWECYSGSLKHHISTPLTT